MSNDTVPRPPRLAATAACAAAALLAVALLLARPSADPGRPAPLAGSGTVEIDGEVYAFTTDTCVVTDDGFVASGPGRWGDEAFVASVSKRGGVHVAFGVDSDVDEPDPGQPWWVSGGLLQSRIDGGTFRATAEVQDRSGGTPGPRTAIVHVSCAPSS